MKKSLLSLSLLACAASSWGAAQTKLVFETADGTQYAFATENLVMTASDGLLHIANADDSKDLQLQGLSKMYFSDTFAAIDNVGSDIAEGPVTVTSLNGVNLGTFETAAEAAASLDAGYYIFTSSQKSYKISIR